MKTQTVASPNPSAQPGSKSRVKVALTFGEMGYAGLPYWPELATLIDINKEIHPKLKGAKKQQAIDAELAKRNLTQADFDRLILRSKRKFYVDSDNDPGDGEIVIPRHVLAGMLVQSVKRAPKNAVPQLNQGLVHTAFQLTEGWLRTGKIRTDAKTYDRFIKSEESNQRRWDSTPYIYDFTATGTLLIEEALVNADDLFKVFEFGGRYIGVGSCREQGYGRFLVNAWERL